MQITDHRISSDFNANFINEHPEIKEKRLKIIQECQSSMINKTIHKLMIKNTATSLLEFFHDFALYDFFKEQNYCFFIGAKNELSTDIIRNILNLRKESNLPAFTEFKKSLSDETKNNLHETDQLVAFMEEMDDFNRVNMQPWK